LPRYIRDLINPWEFQEPKAFIQRCNKIWEDQSDEESHGHLEASLPLQGPCRSSSPFRGKAPAGDASY
jgi:hypothetical protein